MIAPTLRYGGATEFARAVVAWTLVQQGGTLPRQIKTWGDDDLDLWLDTPPPETPGISLSHRIPVTVRTDTPEAFAEIAPRLRAAGFVRLSLRSLEVKDDSRLRLDPGVLQSLEAHVELADLTRAIADAAKRLQVDWAMYPLEMADRGSATEGGVVIDLPIAAIRAGSLRPSSKLHPARYECVVSDDDREAGINLISQLRGLGFHAQRRRLVSISAGFMVRCGSKVPVSLQEKVRGLVDSFMMRLGATDFGLSATSCDGEKIEIEFPAKALREGRLLAELSSPGRHSVRIIAPSAAAAKPLEAELRSWGFRGVRVDVDTDDDPAELRFGSAHSVILDRIGTTVDGIYGPITLAHRKEWPMTDHDIYIRLPKSVATRSAAVLPPKVPAPPAKVSPRTNARRTLVTLIRNHHPARRTLLEVSDTAVRVADVILPRKTNLARHARARSLTRFAGFCVDQPVATTLHFLAMALRAGYPAALEGPTAASKTWTIHYLAAQLGVGVFRLNLNGQADTSELVGRFVPDSERPGTFRWQHGPAPMAMMEGAWLVIDESDLAPAEILERANPLLEVPDPELLLSEYDGSVITAEPGFRVLATWNGTSYAGRQELSPAFLDRFKTRICEAPAETEYRALAECLVHGTQPPIEAGGLCYKGGLEKPVLPELVLLVPEIDRFLTALARFQAGIAAMAESGELRRTGRIAFTRRAFVDVLHELRAQLVASGERRPDRATAVRAAWQALSLCHLERLHQGDERDKALTLLTACGITADAWELPT